MNLYLKFALTFTVTKTIGTDQRIISLVCEITKRGRFLVDDDNDEDDCCKVLLTKMCPRYNDVIELEISVALENGVNGTFINLP